MMNRSYGIILIAVSALSSCEKTSSQEMGRDNKPMPIQYMIGDRCLFDENDVLQKGDSVLIFGEQRADENIYVTIPAKLTPDSFKLTPVENRIGSVQQRA
jgi:hypothetical protein